MQPLEVELDRRGHRRRLGRFTHQLRDGHLQRRHLLDDGHVVGCVCIDEYSPSLVELVSLAVDPSQQGKGLGAQLVKAAVTLAAKRGYPEILAVPFSDSLCQLCGFHFQDIEKYPEKKRRYDRVSADEWTIGHKHCFALALPVEHV